MTVALTEKKMVKKSTEIVSPICMKVFIACSASSNLIALHESEGDDS